MTQSDALPPLAAPTGAAAPTRQVAFIPGHDCPDQMRCTICSPIMGGHFPAALPAGRAPARAAARAGTTPLQAYWISPIDGHRRAMKDGQWYQRADVDALIASLRAEVSRLSARPPADD